MIPQPKGKLFVFNRVSYGSVKTPIHKREYQLGFVGVVGTKKEIFGWAKKNSIPRKKIRILE